MADLDRIRDDLRLTSEREGWSADEAREIGAVIKAALDAGDEAVLSYWAGRLSWWRELLASYGPRLRAFEHEVHASALTRRVSA